MENSDKEDGKAAPGNEESGRQWIFAGYMRIGVRVTLVLSLIIFAIYMIGSMPDPGFSDEFLFMLLQSLRYAALILCVFSLFAMGFGVHRMVYHPGIRNFFGLLFYFSTGVLGAALAMLNSFIVAAAGGVG